MPALRHNLQNPNHKLMKQKTDDLHVTKEEPKAERLKVKCPRPRCSVELDSGPGLSDCRVCASNPSPGKIPLHVGEGRVLETTLQVSLALRY